MIHMTETLAVHTLEGFLTPEETAQVTKLLDEHLEATRWVPARPSEGTVPPEAVQEILAAGIARALPAIRRVFPSVAAATPWDYHDLGPGDRIDAHLHGVGEPDARPQRVARVAFHLQEASRGGEFYVDTCSAEDLWTSRVAGSGSAFVPGTRFAREVSHEGRPEDLAALAGIPRTRWTSAPPAGTAVVYGAQLVHGVETVREGRLRKLITNLLDGPAR
ncbi:hypothetical protein BLA24_21820 [Streptomyces cinnamoneus]|uniref:Fe2OG dioxygenase domain-containing protein n=1 Tax=Streptomyces cinnamoneus TaxID=53446 RepID=A0A2G1XG39_STRCJ|nr:hypothetical protein [Streptomyces cinnamoneus]PHQ50210.1 hypothetical protein BLA24_21820 [Streptomyces cinnamoneus]PPT13006.1 hypothetical protein CYQ11_08965 [Streptomyces cinnamoneus]